MKIYDDYFFGSIIINLKDIMDEKKISINQMSKLANLRYETVRKYYYNEVYLLDVDVLSKFCYFLDIDISTLLTYKYENINEKVHL